MGNTGVTVRYQIVQFYSETALWCRKNRIFWIVFEYLYSICIIYLPAKCRTALF